MEATESAPASGTFCRVHGKQDADVEAASLCMHTMGQCTMRNTAQDILPPSLILYLGIGLTLEVL